MPKAPRQLVLPIVAVLAALAAPVGAQDAVPPAAPAAPAAPTPAPTPVPAQPAAVAPATQDATAAPAAPRVARVARARASGPVATFPGFRILEDGSTRIYVQMSGAVSVEPHPASGILTYTLKGARVTSRNNRNALVTTHFNSPVARVRLVPTKEDVNLVIELRAPTTPTHRVIQESGITVVQVDFPAGTFQVQEDPTPVPRVPMADVVGGEPKKPAGSGQKAPPKAPVGPQAP